MDTRDPRSQHLPEAIKLIKIYYDFKILYDCDHSRIEYGNQIVSMKDNVLSDVTVILNHYYPKDVKYLEKIDYIMDYCPKFLTERKIIPKKYENKLKLVPFCTLITLPAENNKIPEEIRNIINQKYILAGGRNKRDYSQLVKACNKMKMDDVKLIICDTFLHKYGIKDNAYIKTMTVDPEIFELLILHSLFVITPAIDNVHAPVGITVISKSFILGKVCISTVNSGVDDFIIDGVNGFLVKNQPEAYEKAIIYLLNDTNRKKMEANVDKTR